jgi:hypothetical protein
MTAINKRTPGPWSINNSHGATYIECPVTFAPICRVSATNQQGNAVLIKHAPDLLAAVESLLEFAPGNYCDDPRDDRDIDYSRAKAFENAQKLAQKIKGDL